MKNSSLVFLLAISCLSLGWTLGQQRSNPLPARAQLLQEMRKDHEFMDECFYNLKNQFTPGYKAYAVFSRLQDGRSQVNMSQGEVFKTQNPTNLGLKGAGLFELERDGKRLYTRDGRFRFQDGRLLSDSGESQSQALVPLGVPLGKDALPLRPSLEPIKLKMDPKTCLYGGKYTGFHFDEKGILFGENTMTDPVTGESTITTEPLYQIAVAAFESPESLRRTENPSCFAETRESGEARFLELGTTEICSVCPGSLELSNVDFYEQGQVVNALKMYSGLSTESGAPTVPMLQFQSEILKPKNLPGMTAVPGTGPNDAFKLMGPPPTINISHQTMRKVISAGCDPLQPH